MNDNNYRKDPQEDKKSECLIPINSKTILNETSQAKIRTLTSLRDVSLNDSSELNIS